MNRVADICVAYECCTFETGEWFSCPKGLKQQVGPLGSLSGCCNHSLHKDSKKSYSNRMIWRLLSVIALIASTASAASSATVTNCNANSVFHVDSLSVIPTIPVAGQNMTLYTNYDVPAPITEGSATYSCSLNGIPVMNEVYDLCTQTTCPIDVGHHADVSVSTVPTITGNLICKIRWTSGKDDLLCVQTKLFLAPYLRGLLNSET